MGRASASGRWRLADDGRDYRTPVVRLRAGVLPARQTDPADRRVSEVKPKRGTLVDDGGSSSSPTALAPVPAPQSPPRLRFRSPLVKPSVRISRTRLSFKIRPSLTRSYPSRHSGVRSRSPSTASPLGKRTGFPDSTQNFRFPSATETPREGSTATEWPTPQAPTQPDIAASLQPPIGYQREEKIRPSLADARPPRSSCVRG